MSYSPIAGSSAVAALTHASIAARSGEHGPVWIALRDHEEIVERAAALDAMDEAARAARPLFGMPFAVKDNLDLAGLPTTAGCPAYAYLPHESAPVVAALEDAGAVCLGKTHLDQFATGLVGTRSPYGALPNPFHHEYVSGGSSSGSAVAVALGQVAFALGTDTAGSGRVPAAFNNLVAVKPTRGLLSTRGLVPACRSLDCVSIFAADLATAWSVMQIAAHRDLQDPFSRSVPQRPPFAAHGKQALRLGVPGPLEFFGDHASEEQFARIEREWHALGAERLAVPFEPFRLVGDLLYEGPWVAERAAATGAFIDQHPEQCDSVVSGIVGNAARYTAIDAFRASYRLRELAHAIDPIWHDIDALLVPTVPTFPRLSDVAADPIGVNTQLGLYCNFVNLLDLAAISVPAGFRVDGLPGGFTLIAPAGSDHALAMVAHRYLTAHPSRPRTSDRTALAALPPKPLDDGRTLIRLAVAGAHMRGMPLNHELQAAGAHFVRAAKTTPRYRLHALQGRIPKPGLVRAHSGAAIGIELWDVPADHFGIFVRDIPPPLAIGNVEVDDGTWVKGFVCESIALVDATDITHFGDWRSYVESRRPKNASVIAILT